MHIHRERARTNLNNYRHAGLNVQWNFHEPVLPVTWLQNHVDVFFQRDTRRPSLPASGFSVSLQDNFCPRNWRCAGDPANWKIFPRTGPTYVDSIAVILLNFSWTIFSPFLFPFLFTNFEIAIRKESAYSWMKLQSRSYIEIKYAHSGRVSFV